MEWRNEYYQTLARGLEQVRKEMKLSQEEFALKNGIKRRQYLYWIDEDPDPRRKPSPERIEEIAKATGRSVGDFFPGEISVATALQTLCQLHGFQEPKEDKENSSLKRVIDLVNSVSHDPKLLAEVETSISMLSAPKKKKSAKKVQQKIKKAN